MRKSRNVDCNAIKPENGAYNYQHQVNVYGKAFRMSKFRNSTLSFGIYIKILQKVKIQMDNIFLSSMRASIHKPTGPTLCRRLRSGECRG